MSGRSMWRIGVPESQKPRFEYQAHFSLYWLKLCKMQFLHLENEDKKIPAPQVFLGRLVFLGGMWHVTLLAHCM